MNVPVVTGRKGVVGVIVTGGTLFTKGDAKVRNRWAAAGETMTASNPRAAIPSTKGLMNDRMAVPSIEL